MPVLEQMIQVDPGTSQTVVLHIKSTEGSGPLDVVKFVQELDADEIEQHALNQEGWHGTEGTLTRKVMDLVAERINEAQSRPG